MKTFNEVDLTSVHSGQAFIDKPANFKGVNTFTHSGQTSSIQEGKTFRATSELNLVDSTIGNDFDVKWLVEHTILKDDTDPVPITGSLKFAQNVILESDSRIYTLGELGKYEVTVNSGAYTSVSGIYKYYAKLDGRYARIVCICCF